MISYHLGSKLVLPHLNFDILFVKWNSDYLVSKFKELLNDKLYNKKVVFIVNDEESALVRFLFPKIGSNSKIIFWLKENDFKGNTIFEISNFFSYYSSKNNCKNPQLRELYNYWSYNIFLNSSYRNNSIKEKTLQELKNLEYKKLSNTNKVLIDNLTKIYQCQTINTESIIFNQKPNNYSSILKFYINKLFKFNLIQRTEFKNDNLKSKPCDWKSVVITGWYGTETAGDKAILGEIVYRLKKYNENVKIYLTTIDIRLSWCTRDEMDLDINYIPINDSIDFLNSKRISCLIFGGGPLMDSSKLKIISKLFQISQKKNIYKLIYGCGVGPIISKKNESLISNIISLSDFSIYRDKQSYELAISLGGNIEKSRICCDPALLYVRRFKKKNKNKSKKIPMLLRESTDEYQNKSSNKNFLNLIRKDFDYKKFTFIAMHSFWRGNDDRFLFYKILNKSNFKFSDYPFFYYKNLVEILSEINSAKFVIAMRYHSHIFSMGMNKPFLSIDYTGHSGKVANFLQRIDYPFSIKLSKFNLIEFKDKLKVIEKKLDELTSDIISNSEIISETLNSYYKSNWSKKNSL